MPYVGALEVDLSIVGMMALMSEKWLVMASLVSCMLLKDSGLIGPRVMEVWWYG